MSETNGDVKMSDNEFVPGTRVVALWDDDNGEYTAYDVADHFGDNDNTFLSGVVLEQLASEGYVVVHWDDDIDFSYEDDDATSEEVPTELLILESEQASLEEEFNATYKLIEDKLSKACELIAEADAIAETMGSSLYELDDANSSLEGAMRKAGWRTSSWHC
ncbi:MAG TPA: hypothetical protein VII94_02880 [Candidatus Saccharimonadales bacterium]